ncbi:uncharacterized protein LOC135373713 [Ornithodoros turicata]|uniref:uncharacterized protein LOC135373713 n=1 Tax=Ornithodoros turicata TaxID=34597 RepID=UPI003139565A
MSNLAATLPFLPFLLVQLESWSGEISVLDARADSHYHEGYAFTLWKLPSAVECRDPRRQVVALRETTSPFWPMPLRFKQLRSGFYCFTAIKRNCYRECHNVTSSVTQLQGTNPPPRCCDARDVHFTWTSSDSVLDVTVTTSRESVACRLFLVTIWPVPLWSDVCYDQLNKRRHITHQAAANSTTSFFKLNKNEAFCVTIIPGCFDCHLQCPMLASEKVTIGAEFNYIAPAEGERVAENDTLEPIIRFVFIGSILLLAMWTVVIVRIVTTRTVSTRGQFDV